MVFSICGIVKWKGKKIANGIDGKFETNSEKVITRLRTLGFKTIEEAEEDRKKEAEEIRLHELSVKKTEVEVVEEKEPEKPVVQASVPSFKQSVYRRKQR